MESRILIAPAGWEPRYAAGLDLDIARFNPSSIHVPYSSEFASRTAPTRAFARRTAEAARIDYSDSEHPYSDPISLYTSILKLCESIPNRSNVLLNTTTSPRELIWFFLHLLSEQGVEIDLSYYRPTTYDKDWLSRDARSPRLVLKRSGIAYPDYPTCVLALSGYDDERLWQLRNRFEPKTMLIGRQIGEQLENKKRNNPASLVELDGVKYFDFDCYDVTKNAVQAIKSELGKLSTPHNVIAASLGPKTSALTLFRLTNECPEVGLVYIPAGDYSATYSDGFDDENITYCKV